MVFLGRGANLILGQRADLRIRVVASKPYRVATLQKRLNLSHAEARLLVEETDAKRAGFVRQVFHQEPGLGENYDLTLNSDRLSLENMTALVMQTLLECGVLSEKAVMQSSS